MNAKFTDAIRLATQMTRAGNPGDATRLIQASLTGRSADVASQDRKGEPTDRTSDIRPPTPKTPRMAPDTVPDAELVAEPATQPVRRARRPLGAVVAALSRSRLRTIQTQVPHVKIADGARFDTRTYSNDQGARTYRLYIPNLKSAAPAGLVVMLHGCTQTPDDFAIGTGMNAEADRHGFIVAYPEQTPVANASGCWNWFQPANQRRGGGEPAILAGLTRSLRDEFALPKGRSFVAGLSAGGAMAVILGEVYPDVFDAVGVHSGLPYGAASDMVSAFAAMRGPAAAAGVTPSRKAGVPTIVFHGSADATVHPANADTIFQAVHHTTAHGQAFQSETGSANGRSFVRRWITGPDGTGLLEDWRIDRAGHAWSGGNAAGSFADAAGPSASTAMVRFFFGAALAGDDGRI